MKISIIIPTRNRWEKLNECLNRIKKNTKATHETIVICDGDLGAFKRLKNVKCIAIYNSEPKEYFHCINQGCMVAKGEYIVYLSDDAMLRPNWDSHAIETFEKNFKNGLGLVAFRSDMNEGETHAPHGMVSKIFITMEGHLFPEVYKHYFGDTELSLRMQKVNKYVTTEKIVFDHHHRAKDKRYDDQIYSESFKNCWKSDEMNFHFRNPELVAGMMLIKGDRKEPFIYGQWWFK